MPGAAREGAGAGQVVSTGSLMSTGAVNDLQPVTVIGREEIELSGMRNLWDFIASRLDYHSFGLDRPFVLGGFRAALLVNGRSISDSTFDLDSLPVSAVERIEVLSDSAVALYGARAIAGTVNIVLRDRFEGFELQAGGENPVNGGGDTAHLGAFWGTALGGGHLTIGVDVFRRNEIRASQRSYSRARWTPGGAFDDANGVSLYGNTARYSIPNPDGPRPTHPAVAVLGDCEGGAFTGPLANPYGLPGHACGYAYADIAWSWEQRDRDALTIGLDHPVGEDHSLYFDARLVRSDFMRPREAPALTRVPGLQLPAHLLPSTDGSPATLLHRFAGHGHRDARTDLEEHDLTMGAEGRLAYGIGYDAHLRSYRHEEDLDAGAYVHRRVLADPRYDLLNPLSTDPLHLEAIRDSSLRRYRNRFTEHRVARIAFDGRSPEVAGRTLGWAAGAEYAYEKRTRDPVYRDAAGDAVDQEDVIGSFDFSFTGSRARAVEVRRALDTPPRALGGRARRAARRPRRRGVDHGAPGRDALPGARGADASRLLQPGGEGAGHRRAQHRSRRYPSPDIRSADAVPLRDRRRQFRESGARRGSGGQPRVRGGERDGSGDPERGLVPDGPFPAPDHLLRAGARLGPGPGEDAAAGSGDRAGRRRVHHPDRQAGQRRRHDRRLGHRSPGTGGLGRGLGRLRSRRLVVPHDPVP